MNCKICSEETEKIFSTKVLSKYEVDYYKCSNCFFIQTEEPYWLEEAYGRGAIGALDVGIMTRNLVLVEKAKSIIIKLYSNLRNFSGLDYGGGHGVFVRLMRDKGFNFYRQDLYAENLFARYFDISNLPSGYKFDIVTAFEVFEHLNNPIVEVEKMFEHADILLFSTELQPAQDIIELKNWWYIAAEGGQHISFYNEKTLMFLAEKFNAYYYSNATNLHILSKEKLRANPFSKIKKSKKNYLQKFIHKLNSKINKVEGWCRNPEKLQSLTNRDFEFVKKKIKDDES